MMAAEPICSHNTATKAQQPSGVKLRSAKPPRPLCAFAIKHQDRSTPIMLVSWSIRSSKEEKKARFFLLRHVGKWSVFIRWEACACVWALINRNDSIVFLQQVTAGFGFMVSRSGLKQCQDKPPPKATDVCWKSHLYAAILFCWMCFVGSVTAAWTLGQSKSSPNRGSTAFCCFLAINGQWWRVRERLQSQLRVFDRYVAATNGHFYDQWSADYFQEKSINSVKYQQSEAQRLWMATKAATF